MGPHRRILLATDFSSPSREAFVAAVGRACEDGATLLLAHVVEPQAAGVTDLSTDDHLVERITDESRELLATWMSDARACGVREVRCLQLCGTPWRELVTAANEEQVDLIVVGTHGRSGLHHLLLGSVAERVVQHAACSVLVARAQPGSPR